LKPRALPLFTSFSAFLLVRGFLSYFHLNALTRIKIIYLFPKFYYILVPFTFLLLIIVFWFNEILFFEASLYHTNIVKRNLKFGFFGFLLSEIMLFFRLFWAFFHRSLSPRIEIGCRWPPVGIQKILRWGIPLLNTIILLNSGITLTIRHKFWIMGQKKWTILYLILTIFFGLIFIFVQVFEYAVAPFAMNDGIYGRTFYVLTGFHGFHVVIGLLGLLIILFVLCSNSNMNTLNFRAKSTSAMKKLSSRKTEFLSLHRFISLEFAFIYWHFVDIVWIFVFGFVYIWGNS
jgi:heme/copper-type cytochrome/quinol oxidase subunit 3